MTATHHSTAKLPGPDDVLRQEFANGAVLLSRTNLFSPAVAIRGMFPPGALADPPDKIGLANFMASMLMSGTRSHAFRELNDLVESIGATLVFGGGKVATSFAGQCLREDLPQLLEILLEVLTQPAFPEKQFQRTKIQILTAQAIQAQDTAEVAEQAFDRAIYGSHPYAHPDLGYPNTVQSINRDDLQDFHQRLVGPRGLIVAITGGADSEEILQAFSHTLGAWENPSQVSQPPIPPVQAIQATYREHVPLEEKSQSDLVIGTFGPKSTAPDYFASMLGNDILGQFGMMGRIGESVREKAGLAYYVSSSLDMGIGPVTWQVTAGVNPENLDQAIALILQELERFTNELVTEDELADVRSELIGRLPLSMESNAGVAQALLNLERFDYGLNYLRKLPEKLAAITREDILNAAQRYWHLDRLVITSAGKPII
jgi:zinc protease